MKKKLIIILILILTGLFILFYYNFLKNKDGLSNENSFINGKEEIGINVNLK